MIRNRWLSELHIKAEAQWEQQLQHEEEAALAAAEDMEQEDGDEAQGHSKPVVR